MAASSTGAPKNWKKGRQLGRGGFGKVFQCCDQDTGEEMAVKQIELASGTVSDVPEESLELYNEVKILLKCKHKHVVQYYGVLEEESTYSIFIEFMPGGSVADQIKRDGPLTETLTLKYTQQILEGLQYLHSVKIIHRDVKGANVLRDTRGNIKLGDFGVSKQLTSIFTSSGMSNQGTAYWMAPELLRGDRYGDSSDIWSVGCTIVEMLNGKPPYGELEPIQAALKIVSNTDPQFELPPECSTVVPNILKAVFQKPDERPSAAGLLVDYFNFKYATEKKSVEVFDDIVPLYETQITGDLKELKTEFSVEFDVESSESKVTIKGFGDVQAVVPKVEEIFKKYETMLAERVQWSVINRTAQGLTSSPFPFESKKVMEKAYKSGKSSVAIIHEAVPSIVDFTSMTQSTVTTSPSQIMDQITRSEDVQGIDFTTPPNWGGFRGYRTTTEFVVKQLPAKGLAFRAVAENFKSCFDDISSVSITQIEVIQNRGLYLQYMTKKAEVDRQNPGQNNEKILWHGTTANACPMINRYGFNRSLSTRSTLGQGTHFYARSFDAANNSFAKPDRLGAQKVYQCKVLVGCSCTGKEGMKVLPSKYDDVCYDSATNDGNGPEEYAVFNDAQAYPEYLITFKQDPVLVVN